MRQKNYGIRYQMFNRNDQLATKERWFTSDEARSEWLKINTDDIIEVIAYSSPENGIND